MMLVAPSSGVTSEQPSADARGRYFSAIRTSATHRFIAAISILAGYGHDI